MPTPEQLARQNPDVLATEIVEDLRAALEQFSEIAEDVGEQA